MGRRTWRTTVHQDDPTRNVDLIRNILVDEARIALIVTSAEGDLHTYAEYYGKLVLIHKLAFRLKIMLPEKML